MRQRDDGGDAELEFPEPHPDIEHDGEHGEDHSQDGSVLHLASHSSTDAYHASERVRRFQAGSNLVAHGLARHRGLLDADFLVVPSLVGSHQCAGAAGLVQHSFDLPQGDRTVEGQPDDGLLGRGGLFVCVGRGRGGGRFAFGGLGNRWFLDRGEGGLDLLPAELALEGGEDVGPYLLLYLLSTQLREGDVEPLHLDAERHNPADRAHGQLHLLADGRQRGSKCRFTHG